MSVHDRTSIQPTVSVIVPTRRSAETLERCLTSIRSQSYQNIEMIVVDNNSTDRTREIAERFTTHVHIGGPERSAQRNTGARIGSGEYVVFIDSDMVLQPRVIEQCVQTLTEDAAGSAVIIPETSEGEGFWARCKALERRCYIGDDSIEAARFFSRATFETLGGYDETLTGPEDWDLSQHARQLGRIARVSASITHLEGRLTLAETMHAKYYYGKTLGQYFGKHRGRTNGQFRLIRPAFIRHRWDLVAHPILLTGMIYMKACEFLAAAAGLSLSAWRHG